MRGELKAFDTLSEVSDGTAGTSLSGRESSYGDSREDLQELALKLGPELCDERFRVDRRKLEQMLIGGNEAMVSAEGFFKKIQEDTDTVVIWPSRLKVGAKSKKDPNIRIAGRQGDVKIAKELVIAVLDARSNRVTMKLDVSYTDHSHIIGRKGETIQRVMKETGCHIHFPDSNRNNPTEKSNQVSIAGDLDGVEAARQSVRELTPLVFSFELPIVGSVQPMMDSSSPDLHMLQEKYNVQVSFRTRPKLHATLVVIKGSELELERVKEATLLIINLMCKNLANQVFVQMMMEISPQHHSFVLGEKSNNLKMIMHVTNCQIMFPDADDPNIPTIKKSNITFTGRIDDVYKARQMLLGCLPLVLMFDIPDASLVDDDTVSRLMSSLGVHINVRSKPKQSTLSVIVRAVERNASKIYMARHKLLRLEDSAITAAIPDTYHIPTEGVEFGRLLGANSGYGFYGYPSTQRMWGTMPMNYSHLFPPSPMMPPYPPGLGFMPMLAGHGYGGHSPVPQINENLLHVDFMGGKDHDYSFLSSNTSPMSSPSASSHNISTTGTYTDPSVDYSKMMPMWGDLFSDMGKSEGSCVNQDVPSVMQRDFNMSDYEDKKLRAARVKQEQPSAGRYREPTSMWAGYGFSDSSPAPSMKHNMMSTEHSTPWNSPCSPNFTVTNYDNGVSSLITSNLLDATPAKSIESIGNIEDITTLLSSLGLDKYIYMFTSHEIDLKTFSSLNNEDLKEVGVSALGARRKMLVAISDLKSRNSFKSSLAPGAERKWSVGGIKDSLMDRDWQ